MALILDTGPLYAYLDQSDQAHLKSRRLISQSTERLVIPSPVLVELDYFLYTRNHPGVMVTVWDDIIRGAYLVEDLVPNDYSRVSEICEQYADADVGFVDAAILAIVERLNEPKLATLDHRHFGMIRPRHVDSLILVPE